MAQKPIVSTVSGSLNVPDSTNLKSQLDTALSTNSNGTMNAAYINSTVSASTMYRLHINNLNQLDRDYNNMENFQHIGKLNF